MSSPWWSVRTMSMTVVISFLKKFLSIIKFFFWKIRVTLFTIPVSSWELSSIQVETLLSIKSLSRSSSSKLLRSSSLRSRLAHMASCGSLSWGISKRASCSGGTASAIRRRCLRGWAGSSCSSSFRNTRRLGSLEGAGGRELDPPPGFLLARMGLVHWPIRQSFHSPLFSI